VNITTSEAMTFWSLVDGTNFHSADTREQFKCRL